MKGKIYQLLAVVAVALFVLAACQPTGKKNAASYELPAVEDVVMYQVNPRVFAPENSLKAVAERIDSAVAAAQRRPRQPYGLCPADGACRTASLLGAEYRHAAA